MNKGGQTIDYEQYAIFMRKALSGPEISNQDGSLNHLYFNTKKGFYWSEKHNQLLRQGILKHGVVWQKIRQQMFNNSQTEVEIELRACILLGVKEASKITEKQLSQLGKAPVKVAKANGNSNASKKN